jgi:hypothetical protein
MSSIWPSAAASGPDNLLESIFPDVAAKIGRLGLTLSSHRQ